ncbi:hypothetical protein ACP275_11G065300 [Erythranthe tilingii]
MLQRQVRRSSLRESIKALEADVHHANNLVAALPREIGGGDSIQMKLSFGPFTPFLLFVFEWVDFSCFEAFLGFLGLFHILVYRVYVDGMPIVSQEERKASLREFYAVIYPMLKQLEGNLAGLVEDNLKRNQESEVEENKNLCADYERDDECGICMEMDCKVVLPICGHSMCISCFNNWYVRSQSCPFCRGSLKRVASGDLWVLTGESDVVDPTTLAKENLRRFYLYIDKLPVLVSEENLLMYNYMM